MPSAESSSMAAASAASGEGSREYRRVIPISGEPRRVDWRPGLLRAAAYLLVFVSGAATMFVFRGAVAPSPITPETVHDIRVEPAAVVHVPLVREEPPRPLAALATEPKPEIGQGATAALPDTWHVSGTLEPAPGRYARLPLATSQAVAFVDVKTGDRVQKGWQVFSHWESPERLQAAKLDLARSKKVLDVARSQAAAAEKTAARLRKLAGKISVQELQDAETAAEIRGQEVEALELAALESESRFGALEFEFNQAFVTSPIDGIVVAVDVALGERRQAGGPFRGVTILDPSVLHCRCQLDERQLAFVKRFPPAENSRAPAEGNGESAAESGVARATGLRAVVECEGRRFDAQVASIGIVADAVGGLIPVTFEVQNPDLLLRSGTRVSVVLSAPSLGDEP